MTATFKLSELAAHVDGVVVGDAGRTIRGIAALDRAGRSELSFLTNPRYRQAAERSAAGALLVGRGVRVAGRDLLEVAEPYAALARLLQLFHPPEPPRPGVSPDARVEGDVRLGRDVRIEAFAVVGPACEIGERAVIGSGCSLGRDCRVGDDSELRPGVVLYPRTEIGRRCLLHAGVVLGGDGFGFATSGGEHRKVPQVGRVVLEDDVEVGANTTIDRAMLGETRIGRGSKIDDLVMIAHGVRLGPGALLAAQSGIAGSARAGARLTLAGQSGVAGHLELGERVVVAAKSAVFADLDDGAFVAGTPAIDHRRWKRSQALYRRLPELREELARLRERIDVLEQRLAGEE